MTETIPNLWPDKFKVDVQSPLTILRVQANYLSKVTRGILEGTVETESNKETVRHRLVVIAPAYNGYRRDLIVAQHDPSLPYPAEVIADALAEKVKRHDPARALVAPGQNPVLYDTVYPCAYNDDEMQALVQKALQSKQTYALILSLIAKSNELNPPSPAARPNGKNGPESP